MSTARLPLPRRSASAFVLEDERATVEIDPATPSPHAAPTFRAPLAAAIVIAFAIALTAERDASGPPTHRSDGAVRSTDIVSPISTPRPPERQRPRTRPKRRNRPSTTTPSETKTRSIDRRPAAAPPPPPTYAPPAPQPVPSPASGPGEFF